MAAGPAPIHTKPKPRAGGNKSKPVFKTTNPFAEPHWPLIGPKLQQDILVSLVELLSPIAAWRANIPRSKGKRAKQRKRKHSLVDQVTVPADTPGTAPSSSGTADTSRPAPPLLRHLTVGYNSTIRAMEAQHNSRSSTTTTSSTSPIGDHEPSEQLAAVFLVHPTTAVQHAHLPLLATAHCSPSVPLIPLPDGAEAQLCKALGLPRVGLLGLRSGAPGAAAVLAMVQHVPAATAPAFEQMRQGQWLGVKVEASNSHS